MKKEASRKKTSLNKALVSMLERGADEITLTPVVLGELRAGFLMKKHRARYESVLKEFLSSPRVRVRDIDEETADRYAAIVAHLR